MMVVGGGDVCATAPTLGLRQACKGEEAPSPASSSPFRKWAGCTGQGDTKNKLVSSYACRDWASTAQCLTLQCTLVCVSRLGFPTGFLKQLAPP